MQASTHLLLNGKLNEKSFRFIFSFFSFRFRSTDLFLGFLDLSGFVVETSFDKFLLGEGECRLNLELSSNLLTSGSNESGVFSDIIEEVLPDSESILPLAFRDKMNIGVVSLRNEVIFEVCDHDESFTRRKVVEELEVFFGIRFKVILVKSDRLVSEKIKILIFRVEGIAGIRRDRGIVGESLEYLSILGLLESCNLSLNHAVVSSLEVC